MTEVNPEDMATLGQYWIEQEEIKTRYSKKHHRIIYKGAAGILCGAALIFIGGPLSEYNRLNHVLHNPHTNEPTVQQYKTTTAEYASIEQSIASLEQARNLTPKPLLDDLIEEYETTLVQTDTRINELKQTPEFKAYDTWKQNAPGYGVCKILGGLGLMIMAGIWREYAKHKNRQQRQEELNASNKVFIRTKRTWTQDQLKGMGIS
jgi:hypothetical protein